MSFPTRVHVVYFTVPQNQKRSVVHVNHDDKHYIVGFPRHADAYKTAQLFDPRRPLLLKRNNKLDITMDVNFGLSKVGAQVMRVANLTIDPSAYLYIPINYPDTDNWQSLQGAPLTDPYIHTLEMSQFLYLPFTKGIGVILPERGVFDAIHDKAIFEAQVIDPSMCAELAKHELAKSIANSLNVIDE